MTKAPKCGGLFIADNSVYGSTLKSKLVVQECRAPDIGPILPWQDKNNKPLLTSKTGRLGVFRVTPREHEPLLLFHSS